MKKEYVDISLALVLWCHQYYDIPYARINSSNAWNREAKCQSFQHWRELENAAEPPHSLTSPGFRRMSWHTGVHIWFRWSEENPVSFSKATGVFQEIVVPTIWGLLLACDHSSLWVTGKILIKHENAGSIYILKHYRCICWVSILEV